MHAGIEASASYRSRSSLLPGSFATGCLLVLVAMQTTLAQFVSITAHLECTWHTPQGDRLYNPTVRCVVGTNAWHIEGHFIKNAEVAYWLVGTNVAERVTIINSQYLRQAENFVSEHILGRTPPAGLVYPKRGETFIRVHSSPQGQPTDLEGVANATWLAFCSGPYLRRERRQVPVPMNVSSRAWGYRDKTEVFADKLGLPRHVELYSLDDKLVCDYQVLQSTNFFGWTIPLRFKLTAYQCPGNGLAALGVPPTDLVATVTSLSVGAEPRLPEEVKKSLAK
jgi:hypothetical protein